jgi:hypothetical protein
MSATINISYEYVPRFKSGDPEGVNYLEEHGYVVIANALTAEQSTEALNLLWDYLEGLDTGIDRNSRDTWDNDRWPTEAFCPVMA